MKKPIAILDQFVWDGKIVTYMTAFEGHQNDGRMPNSIAVFKIYLKTPKPNLLERIFPFLLYRRMKKWAWFNLVSNQVYP